MEKNCKDVPSYRLDNCGVPLKGPQEIIEGKFIYRKMMTTVE